MAKEKTAEAAAEATKTVELDDIFSEEIDKKTKVRRKYEITHKGKTRAFEVDIKDEKVFGKMEPHFRVMLHPSFPKLYPVDEGNKMLIGIMKESGDATFVATLFEGEKDGKPFIGLEIKAHDGYKLQYKAKTSGGKTIDGFWFSSGERKSLALMGYLELKEVTV